MSYVRAFIRKKAASNVSALSQFVHVSKYDNSLNIGKSNLINIKYHDAEITTSLNMISDVLNVIRHLDR